MDDTQFDEAIDRLGKLKADLANMQLRHDDLAEGIKKEMLRRGIKFRDGNLFRASFVVTNKDIAITSRVAQVLPIRDHPDLYKNVYAESVRVVARSTK